ncbi:C4-dicarboxylate ABC transporter substrate-binding protein [Vibrio sinensis]|uniref:C4-dicarboxylate ABC transporter substrate-binding protein n=1 Tax=Vibrio sinensis TaxID=2302434 RepID=A0A3A6QM64_9VIBR|nr:TRAP transporter substrate-binding protein DctP [Vibrio sinensis]RJX69501.1 C4-dicarboxylate ABC transporter substrate-binding protein [Vibrio sinensis]
MKKTWLALATSAGLLASGAVSAAVEFNVVHLTSPESYNNQSLLVFKNHLETRSNGELKVNIYGSGQLCGSGKECIAGIQAGMFDYFPTTVSEIAYYWNPAESFDLPYLLPNDRVAECVYGNDQFMVDVRTNVLKKAPNVRLMMVANSGGWRNFATNEKEIRTPADVAGLKIRTVPAKIQQDLVRELDGAPTPVAFPEVYTALSTGVVEGTKNGIVDIIQSRLHESLDYLTLDGHGYMGGAWVMSDAKYNTLSPELKRIVLDAIEAQQQYLNSYPKHNEYASYEVFKNSNGKIHNPTAQEKQAFVKATQPVIDNWAANADAEGKQWLERFKTQIKTCEAEIEASYKLTM